MYKYSGIEFKVLRATCAPNDGGYCGIPHSRRPLIWSQKIIVIKGRNSTSYVFLQT